MVYEIVITKAALTDLKVAIEWYNKKGATIGLRLINNFEHSVEKLKSNPQIYTLIANNIRGIGVAKFPYKIFYYFDEKNVEITIIGLVHTKRSESYIQKKLKGF